MIYRLLYLNSINNTNDLQLIILGIYSTHFSYSTATTVNTISDNGCFCGLNSINVPLFNFPLQPHSLKRHTSGILPMYVFHFNFFKYILHLN